MQTLFAELSAASRPEDRIFVGSKPKFGPQAYIAKAPGNRSPLPIDTDGFRDHLARACA